MPSLAEAASFSHVTAMKISFGKSTRVELPHAIPRISL
jgi:hypothetical protein